jgi:hypothetical protein
MSHPDSQKREAGLRVSRSTVLKIPADLHHGILMFQAARRYRTALDALIALVAMGLMVAKYESQMLQHGLSLMHRETKSTKTSGNDWEQEPGLFEQEIEEVRELPRREMKRAGTGF